MASTNPLLLQPNRVLVDHKSESSAREDVDLSHQCNCQHHGSNFFSYTSPLTTDFCERLRALYVANSTSAVDRSRWQKLVNSLHRTPSTTGYHHHQHQRPQTAPLPQTSYNRRRQRPEATSTSAFATAATNDVSRRDNASFHQRPHTSMAVVVDREINDNMPVCNRDGYETSYSKEFSARDADIIPTLSERPDTSVGAVFRMPSNNRLKRTTTYSDEYNVRRDGQQSPGRAKPIYPPNGEKRNNPHPLQTFMIWRLPRSNTTCDNQSRDCIEEQFVKALRGCSNSTYKADYKNLSKEEMCALMKLSPSKSVPRTTYSSTTRSHFRTPPPLSSIAPQLSVPTTRYASNPNRLRPAKGAVPGILISTDGGNEKELQANA